MECNLFLVYTSVEKGDNLDNALDSMRKLDDAIMSWAGWEYKTYIRKTGWADSLFDETIGKMRPKMATLYSRPFARAVAGVIQKMTYDDDRRYFYLDYFVSADTPSQSVTEIFLHQIWHYPTGYDIEIKPKHVSRTWIKDQVLFISIKKLPVDQLIQIFISPKTLINSY